MRSIKEAKEGVRKAPTVRPGTPQIPEGTDLHARNLSERSMVSSCNSFFLLHCFGQELQNGILAAADNHSAFQPFFVHFTKAMFLRYT